MMYYLIYFGRTQSVLFSDNLGEPHEWPRANASLYNEQPRNPLSPRAQLAHHTGKMTRRADTRCWAVHPRGWVLISGRTVRPRCTTYAARH